MLITRRRARRELGAALESQKRAYTALLEEKSDAIRGYCEQYHELLKVNGNLKHENHKLSERLQDTIESLQDATKELDAVNAALTDVVYETSCDGCELIGDVNGCRYCRRKAKDKYKKAGTNNG